jgi:AhpD family alkylhydroperoxidase
VSQLNGCAFCLDMHSKDLRARGETEQRLYMINAWREVPQLYSSRERAALAWAEAVTRLEDQQVPDAIYDMARKEFSEAELAQLTLAMSPSTAGTASTSLSACRQGTTGRRS